MKERDIGLKIPRGMKHSKAWIAERLSCRISVAVKHMVFALALMLIMTGFITDTYAATSKAGTSITTPEIKSKTTTKSSMTVKMTDTKADKYYVRFAETKDMKNYRTNVSDKAEVNVYKLKAETEYYIQVRSAKKINRKMVYSSWSAKTKVKTKENKLGRIKIFSKSTVDNKITLKYNKVKGANGYEVKYSLNKDMSGARKADTTKNSIKVIEGLKYGKTYYLQVKAVKSVGGKVKLVSDWSNKVEVKVNYPVARIKKITATDTKITVNWVDLDKEKNVNMWKGTYEIQVSKSRNFSKIDKKITVDNKTTSYTISGLKSSTRYYVRIRAKIHGRNYIYNNWCYAKSIRTKKLMVDKVHIKHFFDNCYGMTLIYDYARNANGYEVRYSEKSDMSNAVSVIRKKSEDYHNLKGLKENTTYYVQVRGFNSVNGKRNYGEWSDIKSGRTYGFKEDVLNEYRMMKAPLIERYVTDETILGSYLTELPDWAKEIKWDFPKPYCKIMEFGRVYATAGYQDKFGCYTIYYYYAGYGETRREKHDAYVKERIIEYGLDYEKQLATENEIDGDIINPTHATKCSNGEYYYDKYVALWNFSIEKRK